MIKREGLRKSVEELAIGYVLTLYAARTHKMGIVPYGTAELLSKSLVQNFCGKCD